MFKDIAYKVLPLLRGLKHGRPENDFSEENGWYIRVYLKEREFHLRGDEGNFKLFEVGLGENRIGYRTVAEKIKTLDLRETIKELQDV
jgi:hypothetical protein